MATPSKKSWDRIPGESEAAFSAFRAFLEQPKPRRVSLTLVAGEWVEGKTTLTFWANEFFWKDRAKAYDAYLVAAEDEARRRARAREADAVETRRVRVREDEWRLADALKLKAVQMLAFPLATTTETTSRDGQTIHITHYPANWALRDVAAFLKVADQLARLAVGLNPTSVDSGGLSPASGDRTENVPDEIVARWRDAAAQHAMENDEVDDPGPDA